MQTLNWNDLRYILAVARTGTLALAARKLKANETTVSRRLARVELTLSARLFDRVNGRYLPTRSGEQVIQQAERAEQAVKELTTAVAGTDASASGTVRVTTIPLLANRLLVPSLKTLYEQHPELRIELCSNPRNLDVTKREADIALRPARPHREHRAVARRIGQLAYAVYGRKGRAYTTLPWIMFEDEMAELPHVAWIGRAMKQDGASPPRLLVNDGEVVVHALLAGLGKSLLPCAVGDRLPGLKRLSGREPVVVRELWTMIHPDLRRLPRITAVTGWIEKSLEAFE